MMTLFSLHRTWLFVAAGATVLLSACEPEIKPNTSGKPFSSGKTNVTRIVSVGGDYLSGMTDNEQFKSGQESSVAAIVAGQLRKVGAGVFRQPLMFDEYGLDTRVRLSRQNDCLGNEELTVIPYGIGDGRNSQNIGPNGPYNNLAVPDARVADLNTNSYGGSNPYFARFASKTTSSIMDDAQLIDPTFFMLWAGDRDVYGYAENGGNVGLNAPSITSVTNFRNNLETTIQKLVSRGAKGVIANIPSISSLPFYTTIPYDAIELTADQADQLNLIYAANPNLVFREGKNPFVINDGGVFARFARPSEYIRITINLDSVKCKGYGSFTALPDQEVLSDNEIADVNQAIERFNGIINELGVKYGVPVFDANTLFANINRVGINFDGITYNNQFVIGGFISLDGVHPTKRGNAIIANEIIKLINDRYAAKVPLCDINLYPTVEIP